MITSEKSIPITIILTLYNAESYIEKCVDTILQSTLEDIEIVFVDDCSIDNTLQVLRSALGNYSNKNIIIVSHDRNMGVAAARNTGLQHVHGKYFIYADADDYVAKDYYEILYEKALQENSDVVQCNYCTVTGDKVTVNEQDFSCDRIECLERLLTGRIHGSTCNKLYKTEILKKSSAHFDNGYNYCEDLYFNILFYTFAETISIAETSGYYYVQSEGSITRDINSIRMSTKIRDVKHYIDKIDDFLKENKLEKTLYPALMHRKAMLKNQCFGNLMLAYKEFIDTYPEANNFIRKLPYVSKKIGFVQKLILLFR